MKIYKVRMHRSAVQDLNEIFEFLMRWVYVFHIEDDKGIVDRIRPSKLIKK